MIYLYILIGGFVLMTVLFILAETEVKKLKRLMAEQNENERFDSVYRQMQSESDSMENRVRETQEYIDRETDAIYRRITAMEEKIEAHLKKR